MNLFEKLDYLGNVIIALAMLGLVLAVVTDHLQVFAKFLGARRGQIARGYNLAMQIMVCNRVGAVLYFTLIALSIDRGLQFDKLRMWIIGTIVFITLCNLVIAVWYRRFFLAHEHRFVLPLKAEVPVVIANIIATIFNLLGLTVPFLLGSLYPDYRLTLANTSFLFNTFFTVINVFYIEHVFAKLVDAGSSRMAHFVLFMTVSRALASTIVLLVLASLSL